MIEKNDSRVIRAWALYDWANSAYPLVVTTAIFPIFYQTVTSSTSHDGTVNDLVSFFGFEFINTELYSYVLSLSFLVVSAMSPLLSGIADYSGKKRKFLEIFCYIGAGGCMGLYFFDPSMLEFSMLFVFIASIGYWGSLVFYNAFLPEIATPDMHDQVSAKGFAYGYVGSSILLLAILVVVQTEIMPARWAFPLVAVWWVGFAQITYRKLPNNVHNRRPDEKQILWKGYQELKKVWKELAEMKNLRRYLRSFFVYSMGVQTVMLMAVLFAKKEIDWGNQGDSGLIISVLIIQFIAVFGANLFARVSRKKGNKWVLIVALVIWTFICLAAFFITKAIHFYLLAAVVGFVMGGIQALSRSTYSKMLPETKDHASYFSFYEVLEKLGIVLGTFFFGFIEGVTSSMRFSALLLMLFFVVGLILLIRVRSEPNISPNLT